MACRRHGRAPVRHREQWHKLRMRDDIVVCASPPPSFPTGDDYRDLVGKIREVAGRTGCALAITREATFGASS